MKISCSCRPRLQIATISSASLRSTRSTRTGAPRTSVVNETVSLSLRCLRCLLLVMCTYPFAKKAVLPPLSVGEMMLRLYGALNYSQNSAHDLRRALNGS